MLTANCARVKKGNVLAKNGIVHITDRVVVPATESIEDIIRTHPKLQNLRKGTQYLNNTSGTFTYSIFLFSLGKH